MEVCTMYIFPLILYHLFVLPLPKNHRLVLQRSHFKVIWRGQRPMVHRQVCCQFTKRLAYLGLFLLKDTVWRWKATLFLPLSQTQKLKVNVGGWAKHHLSVNAVRPFETILDPVTIISLKRNYQDLVLGSALDPLGNWLGRSIEGFHLQWNWAPSLGFLNNSEFLLTWWLAQNAFPLFSVNYKAGLADMPDCPHSGIDLEETTEHAFYYCERVCPFWNHVGEWTAHVEPKQLMLLDIGYIIDVLLQFQGKKHVVF